YQDFVKSSKKFRLPTDKERAALQDLADALRKIPETESAEFIQNEVFEAGKRHFAKEELRQWFKTLYEVLLGSEQGPRMGAFIKLFGRDNVVRLIDRVLAPMVVFDYLNPKIPPGLRIVDVPLVPATPATIKGYGEIARDQNHPI